MTDDRDPPGAAQRVHPLADALFQRQVTGINDAIRGIEIRCDRCNAEVDLANLLGVRCWDAESAQYAMVPGSYCPSCAAIVDAEHNSAPRPPPRRALGPTLEQQWAAEALAAYKTKLDDEIRTMAFVAKWLRPPGDEQRAAPVPDDSAAERQPDDSGPRDGR